MALQLIYTSAPRLLQAGRTGFGTVAKHAAIRGALQSEIERFSQFSRQEGLRPDRVIFQYRSLSISGAQFHVISRLKDAGSDYTGRTNHIAQHVIFSSAEAHAATAAGITPADVIFNLNARSFWCDSWHAAPIEFGPEEEIALSSISPAITLPATYWQELTGTPDSAAILAPGQTAESCWVIYAPGHGEQLLALLGESLLLHPNPWRISFANEFQPTDRVDEIAWRGIPADSPVRITATQSVRPILDLTHPAGLPSPVPEFTAKAALAYHQESDWQGNLGQIVAPSPTSGVVEEAFVRKAGHQPPPGKRTERPIASKSPQSLKGLKRQAQKKEDRQPRSPIALYLTITAALVAVALAGGTWFLSKIQKEHRVAQDRYELAKDNFLHTAGIVESKAPPGEGGKDNNASSSEDASAKDLERAAALFETATRDHDNTSLALKDASALKSNQTDNANLHNKLTVLGNKFIEKIVSRVETQCLLTTRNGKIDELKKLIDVFDQDSEIEKLLDDASKKKLEQFRTFISHWDSRDYPAIIMFLHERKVSDCEATRNVDDNYARVLSSNPATELSKLEAIPDEQLADYPKLFKRKSILKNPPIADAGITTPNPTQSPNSPGEKPAVVPAKLEAPPARLKWMLCPDKESYENAIKAQSSKKLGVLKNPGKAGLAELLKSPSMDGIKQVIYVAAKSDAADSPFFCVLNDKNLPDVVIVNCEKLKGQPISRDMIDTPATAVIVIKEKSLFNLFSSQTVETPDGKKVLFYFQFPDADVQQVTDKTISNLDRFNAIKKHLDDLTTAEQKLQNCSPPLNTEDQSAIESWLGEKGPASLLAQKKITFKDFLVKKFNSNSSALLVEILKGHDVKALLDEYIKKCLTDFEASKPKSFDKDWKTENKDSIRALHTEVNKSKNMIDLFAKANNVSNKPAEISALFNNTYLPAAKALDAIHDFYLSNKTAQQTLTKDKQKTINEVSKYSDLSQSIKFISKDQSGNVILELSIEPK